MSELVTLSKKNKLSELLEKYPNLIIKASAKWCRPCKEIAPYFDELSKQFTDFTFCTFDVNQCEDLSDELKIRSLPTFIRIENGEEKSRIVGADKGKLQKLLSK